MRGVFESRMAAALVWAGVAAALAAPGFVPERNGRIRIVEPKWPVTVEGSRVEEVPLSSAERRFDSGFPGRIRKFTDGDRLFILRWVTRPTRQLHPAADCFRGLGYEVRNGGAVRVGADGGVWGCFEAVRDGSRLEVRERITDASGRSWTDVQAWFWAAALGRSVGPWWAVTVVDQSSAFSSMSLK